MSTCVADVTDHDFQQQVVEHPGAVLVDFYTPSCAPCRVMAPVLEAICAERGAALKIVKVNAADHGQRAVALGVRGVPTFVLFSRGQPIASTTGSVPRAQFERWIDTELARAT